MCGGCEKIIESVTMCPNVNECNWRRSKSFERESENYEIKIHFSRSKGPILQRKFPQSIYAAADGVKRYDWLFKIYQPIKSYKPAQSYCTHEIFFVGSGPED